MTTDNGTPVPRSTVVGYVVAYQIRDRFDNLQLRFWPDWFPTEADAVEELNLRKGDGWDVLFNRRVLYVGDVRALEGEG